MISENSLYPLQPFTFITVGPEEETAKKVKTVDFDHISEILLEIFTQPTTPKLSY